MSRKRRPEDNEQMNIDPSPASQKEDLAASLEEDLTASLEEDLTASQEEARPKPGKVSALATLLDLPMELHERILLDAIVAELMDRKLFRSGWKKSADRVMKRHSNLSQLWDSILKTNVFRKRLHEILGTFLPVKMCLKVVQQHQFSLWCVAAAALDDEFFLVCHPPQQQVAIKVYDRSNLQKEKSLIQLPEVTTAWYLEACSVTKCLYLLHHDSSGVKILRVSKREQHFDVSPWMTCSTQLSSKMTISADGSVVLFQGPAPATIKVFNPDGSLTHQMELSTRFSVVRGIISKSNGNFVLVSKDLVEIDRKGSTVPEHSSRISQSNGPLRFFAVDMYDRIMTVDGNCGCKLLDAEFNAADAKIVGLHQTGFTKIVGRLQYDRQGNEFIMLDDSGDSGEASAADLPIQWLSIITFTERVIPKDAQSDQN